MISSDESNIFRTGSLELTASPAGGDPSGSQGDIRLGKVLQTYAVAQDKIGRARLAQDSAITNNFSKPWNTTLNTQISAAMRARASVKSARLSLDASRAKYKALGAVAGGGGQKREQARLDVEAAEEALVTATEEAINLMRAVLDDVSIYQSPFVHNTLILAVPNSQNLSSPYLHLSRRS